MAKIKLSINVITSISLIAVFALALFLRVYHLNLNTPALYIDETAGQYISRMRMLAVNSNIFEFLYNKIFFGTFSFSWFLGLTPLGARLPAALYGSLSIFTIYYFASVVRGSNRNPTQVALLAAFIAALSPWNIRISRVGHTAIPLLVIFISLHVFLYLKSNSVKSYLISIIPLVVAVYYYPSMVIIAPIISLLLLRQINSIKSIKQNRLNVFITLTLLVITGLIFAFKYSGFSILNRGLDLAIWRDVNTVWETDKFRGLSWLSKPDLFSFGIQPEQLASKITYNTIVASVNIFTRNYLSFFSPDFLFLRGDAILRHSTGQVGAFLPFLMPFMLYGAFVFFKEQTAKNKQLFLVWILASPIPAAITKDGAGYLLRAITMMPFLTYFCALGIVGSSTLINKRLRLAYGLVLTLVGLYSAYYFLFGYFHVYPATSAKAYEYGFKELSDFQQSHNNDSMLVIWDGYYPNMHFRFWQKTPFDQYSSFTPSDIVIGDSHFHKMYSNLYFSLPFKTNELKNFITAYQPVYLVYPDEFINKNPQFKTLVGEPTEIITYPDQTPDFYIYKVR